MKIPGWTLLVGAALLAVVSLRVMSCQSEQRGALDARIEAGKADVRRRDSLIVDLMQRQRGKDTVYRKADTVWRKAKAVYLADPGDSTKAAAAVEACSVVLVSCVDQVANLKDIVAQQRTNLFVKDTIIGRLEKRKTKHWGCAGPGVVSREGVDLGIGCGYVVAF